MVLISTPSIEGEKKKVRWDSQAVVVTLNTADMQGTLSLSKSLQHVLLVVPRGLYRCYLFRKVCGDVVQSSSSGARILEFKSSSTDFISQSLSS